MGASMVVRALAAATAASLGTAIRAWAALKNAICVVSLAFSRQGGGGGRRLCSGL